MSATQRHARLLEAVSPVPFARPPNMDWLSFLDGPLSADDWSLIDRVERGEVTVDEAMTIKKRIAA
jgi:hypothetical protein